MEQHNNCPLCVDLDGTLIKSDVVIESFVLLLKKNIFYVFLAFFWLLKGKPYFKTQIAKRVDVDVKQLSYNKEVLQYIETNMHRKRVLVTGTQQKYADQISDFLGLFDEAYGATPNNNLTGKDKARFLKEKYGTFEYAGNSTKDISVWEESESVTVVSPNERFIKKISLRFKNVKSFKLNSPSFRDWCKSLRVMQWSKNLLLFAPMLAAHQFQFSDIGKTILGFLSFSFIASAVYQLNDIFDLNADRAHPRKKERPIASALISIKSAFVASAIFLIIGFCFANILSNEFVLLICGYLILTTLYSLYLKQFMIIDVIVLSLLYTLRLFAGAVILHISLTEWLLVFAVFLFFSLAILKRASELILISKTNKELPKGRAYMLTDIVPLFVLGFTSGLISILVFALYISSDAVKHLYHHPQYFWGIMVLILYWISCLWLLAFRGKVVDDPILYTIRDKKTYFISAITILIFYFAI